MATNTEVQIVFGGFNLLAGSEKTAGEWLSIIEQTGIKVIDTGAIYGQSEELLGKVKAASRFTVDTKAPGGFDPNILSTKDNIIAQCKESLKKLNTSKLDIYYMHSPDRRVSVKETLSGLDELYKQGLFKRLGISNYLPHEIEEMVKVAKENNFVVPTVYQGNYSAIARRCEDEIFPIIRKHGMAFYAYSPIAGGFLAKSKTSLNEAGGRFGKGQPLAEVYSGMYDKTSFVEALDVWGQIAEAEKISRSELAYRWIVHHSHLDGSKGDGLCIGARNVEQLEQTVRFIKAGPLSDTSVKKIEGIWSSVKADAFLDNLNRGS